MQRSTLPLLMPLMLCAATAFADGVVVDKIYHPYVQQFEQELEWRAILQDEQIGVADNLQLHRFGYGRSIGGRWFGEFNVTGQNAADQAVTVEAYEIEARVQMSEQGELWADWGLQFELEREAQKNLWEFAAVLLVEKEWGRWSGTGNLALIQEWGRDFTDELETSLGLQLRYRHSPLLEPAVELYSGQTSKGIGPVLRGQVRPSVGRRLIWEAGVIYGLEGDSAERTLRAMLEFEF